MADRWEDVVEAAVDESLAEFDINYYEQDVYSAPEMVTGAVVAALEERYVISPKVEA